MQLTSCCGCYSLKAGTLFTGILGIILSIISLILIFTLNVEWKTILIDVLDQSIVKIIFAINLCMTILISTLLIIGAIKRNTFMMLPWVVLGLILVVGLLVSVLYTSIMFFVNHAVINGILWLVIGLIAVERKKKYCFSDLHVLVVGSVQLFPVSEVRQIEQQNRPVRKTVQLPTTLKRIGEFHETKAPSSPRRNWIVLSFFTRKGTISSHRTKERSNCFGER
ncbi:hypothetical protein E2986_10789 [Frieseomelitta varia]|uniref:Uncharacterized protein n=1 Tax=Frieseomelitta varia TaxID=561572 RepID=A0A833RSH5_9HYME|nr:hypothetical protein E2986_10789 [Frieseomelitta varia]